MEDVWNMDSCLRVAVESGIAPLFQERAENVHYTYFEELKNGGERFPEGIAQAPEKHLTSIYEYGFYHWALPTGQ